MAPREGDFDLLPTKGDSEEQSEGRIALDELVA